MISFESDYIQGAAQEVLDALVKTNMEALSGYGADEYTESAVAKIKKACKKDDAQVWFLTGGTQTNAFVISTLLQRYQGVVAAETGHIATHEGGAIEFTGHKVLTLPAHLGKIEAAELEDYLAVFFADGNHSHMVEPGMCYISQPTEYGTIYSKKELEDISNVCHKYNMPLYADGARLGYALAATSADFALEDMAKYCDVFYIGGTKVGALCGEALVYTHNNMPHHFVTLVKQSGALLAKGRLNSIQFDTLFTNDLYMNISRHAIKMADRMEKIFREKGYEFFIESPTNQKFVILENSKKAALEKEVKFSFWEKYDDNHTVVRFATSWATLESDLDKLEKLL